MRWRAAMGERQVEGEKGRAATGKRGEEKGVCGVLLLICMYACVCVCVCVC